MLIKDAEFAIKESRVLNIDRVLQPFSRENTFLGTLLKPIRTVSADRLSSYLLNFALANRCWILTFDSEFHNETQFSFWQHEPPPGPLVNLAVHMIISINKTKFTPFPRSSFPRGDRLSPRGP